MDLRLALGGYVLFLAFLVYVCVLADPNSDSLGGKTNILLTETIPDLISAKLRKVLPARAFSLLDSAYDYVMNQKNPLLQIFYLVLFVGSFIVYLVYGWRRMSEVDILGSSSLVLVCLYSFSLACSMTPGFVTHQSVERFQSYAYDNVIYKSGRTCSTCQVEKVARSKHCRLCGGCIARFDHHCGWLNQCVGEENYRHFLVFLALHAVTFAYGASCLVKLFMHEVRAKKLMTATFYNAHTRKPVQSTPLVVVQYFIAHEAPLCGVLALSVVMTVVISGFLGYHLMLVKQNMTTNETFKWNEVRRKIAATRESLARAREASGGSFEEEGPADPTNAYDMGLVQNFREVWCPRSYGRKVVEGGGRKGRARTKTHDE